MLYILAEEAFTRPPIQVEESVLELARSHSFHSRDFSQYRLFTFNRLTLEMTYSKKVWIPAPNPLL